ncbi:hypothetical protein KRM28CT15_43780 [Krasilnikovia sp. M28-CT-15]
MPSIRFSVSVVALFAVLAVGGCSDGGSDGDSDAAPGGLPAPEAVSAEPTPSERAWVAPCTLLTDADVFAGLTAPGLKVTVLDKTEKNDQDNHSGSCDYAVEESYRTAGGTVTMGGKDSETVFFRVNTRGGLREFADFAGDDPESLVQGLGDQAYWQDEEQSEIHVRVGDFWFTIDNKTSTADESVPILEVQRKASLALAKSVLTKLV